MFCHNKRHSNGAHELVASRQTATHIAVPFLQGTHAIAARTQHHMFGTTAAHPEEALLLFSCPAMSCRVARDVVDVTTARLPATIC